MRRVPWLAGKVSVVSVKGGVVCRSGGGGAMLGGRGEAGGRAVGGGVANGYLLVGDGLLGYGEDQILAFGYGGTGD